jgi:hypothetical protein
MGLRNPKNEPAMDNGTEIRNQITRVANMVPRGTAPEECAAMRKKLRKRNVPKTTLRVSPARGGGGDPGTRRGVRMMFSFQFSPPRVLYAWELTKPPMNPKKTYKMIITVANAPRLLGDKNPSNAKTNPVNIRRSVYMWGVGGYLWLRQPS